MIESTCIFCKHRIIEMGSPLFDKVTFETVSVSKLCRKCHVNQTFSTDGKVLRYSFTVDNYLLAFDLEYNQFRIREKAEYNNILLSCNYVPRDLTPFNVTVEKIKTLILFS